MTRFPSNPKISIDPDLTLYFPRSFVLIGFSVFIAFLSALFYLGARSMEKLGGKLSQHASTQTSPRGDFQRPRSGTSLSTLGNAFVLPADYDYNNSTTHNYLWSGPSPAPFVGKYAGLRLRMDYSYHRHYRPERQVMRYSLLSFLIPSVDQFVSSLDLLSLSCFLMYCVSCCPHSICTTSLLKMHWEASEETSNARSSRKPGLCLLPAPWYTHCFVRSLLPPYLHE
jgi:hypothetical protein